jgi:hypothetical protein
MRITTKILAVLLPGIVIGHLLAVSAPSPVVDGPQATALSQAEASINNASLSFHPNLGQTDPRVQFLSRGPGYSVFFTRDETIFSLRDSKTSRSVVRMKFAGAAPKASAQPLEALPDTSNYFIGNDSSKWVTGVPEYAKLRYNDVYPGSDVVYQGGRQQLRYDSS